MIDINSNSLNPIAARLSNFTLRTFDFDGVQCVSIESVLQAFKFDDNHELQCQICLMSPKVAKEMGAQFPDWKQEKKLFWNGNYYNRLNNEYQELITNLYDTVCDQDPTFTDDLFALRREKICHSIGLSDPLNTVLTENEFIDQLNRLRMTAKGLVLKPGALILQ